MKLKKIFSSLFSKHIVLSLILSYLIVFMIPFINNLYTYISTENEVEQRIYRINSQTLDNLSYSFDKSISELQSFAVAAQNTESIQKLMTLMPGQSGFDINRILAAKELKNLVRSSTVISDIYVYIPYNNYVIGMLHTNNCEKYFSYAYGNNSEKFDEWMGNLNNYSYSSYMTSYTDEGYKFTDLFFSVPLGGSVPKATVGIRIPNSYFENTIASYSESSDNSFAVIDKNNSIIFSYGTPGEPKYEKLTDGISFDKKDKNFYISRTSDVNKWKYFSVTPKSYISDQLAYLRLPLAISIIFSVLIAFALIFYFTRKNYTPFKKIISVARAKNTFDTQQSEYDIIDELLKDYISNRKELNTIKHYEVTSKKSRFLSGLVHGTVDEDSLKKQMKHFDIEFISDYFAVICFNIINANQLFSDDESYSNSDEETAKTIKFIMTNILEELVGKHHRGYMAEYNGRLVCIVSFNDSRLSHWQEDITQVINEARQFIEANFRFSFTAGVSNIYTGISALPLANSEAIKAISYRSLMKNDDMIVFENLNNSPDDLFNKETESKLINFINICNPDIAKTMLDSIFTTPALGVKHTYMLIIKVVCAVSSAVFSTSEYETSTEFSDASELIHSLMAKNGGYEVYRDELHTLIDISCNIMKKKAKAEQMYNLSKDSKNSDILIENVKEYIASNYSNSELHLVALGEHFSITPYYLSNIFKKTEGISLMDYIARLRVDMAKKIIDDSPNTAMQDISETVGFNNARTFLRTFRKFEGITPSQYKEKH